MVVRRLLEAWWEHPAESVSPPTIINGYELMNELHLSPGPRVGRLLEAIREAQAMGSLRTKDEALAFARTFSLDEL